MHTPQRIACLTEETVETLYLLGEEDRIVGISGYTVRPPEARRDKVKVSAFTSAKIEKILELKPDLVLTFSDLQANIVADLVSRGIEVHAFNQRDLDGIFRMIETLGTLIGAVERAEKLIAKLNTGLENARKRADMLQKRPKVFFEEWDEPLISGIGWVSELITIAGGKDIFSERAGGNAAKDRFVTHEEVVVRAPDIVIGSWCGKRFIPEKVRARPGFDRVPAVVTGELHEIKSSIILQPGPAALTDGLAALQSIIARWAEG